MNIAEIISKFSKLNVYEERNVTDDYAEFVFYHKEIESWNKAFTDIFGPPVKPPGKKATEDELNLTQDFGGINDNQTLFKKEFADVTAIAMFWPWQDSLHTTLKIALLKR